MSAAIYRDRRAIPRLGRTRSDRAPPTIREPMTNWAHPVLTCDETRELENKLFGRDEAREWPAMQRAGRAIAAAVLQDYREIGGFPADGRILTVVGKGHNGGDALIATQAILEKFPAAQATIIFAFGQKPLRPLAARAWRELSQSGRD